MSAPSYGEENNGATARQLRAVLSVAQRLREIDKGEELFAFDRNGNQIIHKKSSTDKIFLRPVELSKLEHSAITHNHVGGSPMTIQDLRFTIGVNAAYMRTEPSNRAVIAYRSTAVRSANGWPRLDSFEGLVSFHWQKAAAQVRKLFANGKISVSEANTLLNRRVLNAVARELNLPLVTRRIP